MLLLTILTLRLGDAFIHLGQKDSASWVIADLLARVAQNHSRFFTLLSSSSERHTWLSHRPSLAIHLPHYQLFTFAPSFFFCTMHLNGVFRDPSLSCADTLSYFTVTSILQLRTATVGKKRVPHLCQEEELNGKHATALPKTGRKKMDSNQ